MSRQRRWQLEQRRKHRCILCGLPAARSKRKGSGGFSPRCPKHQVEWRELWRRKKGCVKRNYNAASYAALIVALLVVNCASNSHRVGFEHQTWKPGKTIDPVTNTIVTPDWSVVPPPSK